MFAGVDQRSVRFIFSGSNQLMKVFVIPLFQSTTASTNIDQLQFLGNFSVLLVLYALLKYLRFLLAEVYVHSLMVINLGVLDICL